MPPPDGIHCTIYPTAVGLDDGPAGEALVQQPIAGDPERVSLRLFVSPGRQVCRTHVATDVVETAFADEPAGALGLYIQGGEAWIESLRAWEVPAGCDPADPPPPAPPP